MPMMAAVEEKKEMTAVQSLGPGCEMQTRQGSKDGAFVNAGVKATYKIWWLTVLTLDLSYSKTNKNLSSFLLLILTFWKNPRINLRVNLSISNLLFGVLVE